MNPRLFYLHFLGFPFPSRTRKNIDTVHLINRFLDLFDFLLGPSGEALCELVMFDNYQWKLIESSGFLDDQKLAVMTKDLHKNNQKEVEY